MTPFKFANGLTVALLHLPGATAVACSFEAQAGPRFESADGHGATHVLEHLLFRGCQAHPSPALHAAAFEDVGASPEAQGDLGSLRISMTVPRSTLFEAVELLGATVSHPTFAAFEQALFAAQMVVGEDYDNGELRDVSSVLFQRVFKGHPSARPAGGSPTSLSRLTVERLKQEYQRIIVGGNCVLVIAGDLGAATKQADLLKHLGEVFDLPAGRALGSMPFTPVRRIAPDIHFLGDYAEDTLINVGFHGPKWSSSRGPAATVLLSVLGEGVSCRMVKALRAQQGICLDHAAHVVGRTSDPLATFSIASPAAKVGEAMKAFLNMLKLVAGRGVYPEELARVKRLLRMDAEKGLGDPETAASWYGVDLLHVPSDMTGPLQYLVAIEAVTTVDLQEVAQALFAPGNMTMVVDSANAQGKREILEAVEHYGKPRVVS